MISGLFLYSHKGEVLLYRLYRDDIRRSVSEIFRIHVIANPNIRSPVITFGSTTFFHIRSEDIYITAVSKANINTAMVFEFLYKFVKIGLSYFNKFDEETVKNNYTTLYELLDEILDYGFPQNSEIESLKMYIATGGVSTEKLQRDSQKITMITTGAISWRKDDIRYRRNECFIDVIEALNLIMSNKGSILKVDVSGQIVVKSYLSGMPECKLGLNDKVLMDRAKQDKGSASSAQRKKTNAVELDDCQFHQCVRLGRFDVDRTISFIPPDGEFELMRYRTTENINLPFRVHAIVNEIGKNRVEYKILIKATFNSKLSATNVKVHVPTPPNTAGVRCRVTAGKAKYKPGDNGIVWKIGRFNGQLELSLSADADLTSTTTVKKAWSRPPVSLDFQVPMYAASGLHVRFLKVFEKSNYPTVKWVRYITKAGSCQYRI